MPRKRKAGQTTITTVPLKRERYVLSAGTVEIYADEGEHHARYSCNLFGRGENPRLALADLVRQLQSLTKEIDTL